MSHHWHEPWFVGRMQDDSLSPPLWHFPVTAMPDPLPEPLDPMELIARWQAEVEANADTHTANDHR